jgi:hypothetical protein
MSDDLRNRIEDVRADFASGAEEGPEILSKGRADITFHLRSAHPPLIIPDFPLVPS